MFNIRLTCSALSQVVCALTSVCFLAGDFVLCHKRLIELLGNIYLLFLLTSCFCVKNMAVVFVVRVGRVLQKAGEK